MFKKGLPFILAALIFIALPTAAFAGIQLNPVDQGDIILIQPQIGSEKQVFVKDSLAISIRTEGDADMDVSLYKVMPSSPETELENALKSDMVTTAEAVPFEVISGGSIVARDLSQAFVDRAPEVDAAVESVVVNADRAEQSSIIDGTQALLKKDRLTSKERQEVIEAFTGARKGLKRQLSRLEDAYDALVDMFPDGFGEDREYSDSELEVIEAYLVQVSEVVDSRRRFEEAQRGYVAIFEIPIFGPEPLSDTGIVPYYQKTVEKITPGLYKFVFSDHDTQEILEVIEFEVSKNVELTEEDIKKSIPLSMGQFLNPSLEKDEQADASESDKLSGSDVPEDAGDVDGPDASPETDAGNEE